jgi:ubiquinone/menaquinone biosynthesis C-methylase UbiE
LERFSQQGANMSQKEFLSKFEILRSPKRIAQLEVQRVVELSLNGIHIKSVLDVGTGTGLFAEAFSSFVDDVSGIDVNIEMIKIAKDFVFTAKFLQSSAGSIPFGNDKFDLVFLGHMLHESHSPSSALLEAKRCSKKRTVVLEWPYQDEKIGPPLERRIKPEEIIEMVDCAKFQHVEAVPLTHMVLYRLTC